MGSQLATPGSSSSAEGSVVNMWRTLRARKGLTFFPLLLFLESFSHRSIFSAFVRVPFFLLFQHSLLMIFLGFHVSFSDTARHPVWRHLSAECRGHVTHSGRCFRWRLIVRSLWTAVISRHCKVKLLDLKTTCGSACSRTTWICVTAPYTPYQTAGSWVRIPANDIPVGIHKRLYSPCRSCTCNNIQDLGVCTAWFLELCEGSRPSLKGSSSSCHSSGG